MSGLERPRVAILYRAGFVSGKAGEDFWEDRGALLGGGDEGLIHWCLV